MGYELIDHTGDLGLKIRSADLKSLFCEAATALFDVISDLDLIEVREEREISVVGMDNEELLVAWLNELLYLHEVERLLFRDFKIIEIGEGKLKGTAGGEVLREEYHIIKTAIKAVTYHQLEVRKENGGWSGRIIFDI